MPSNRLLLTCLSVLLASCTKPCHRADLESVNTTCRVEEAFAPTFQTCRDAGLSPPDPATESDESVAANVQICDDLGHGAFWECLAAGCSAAADGGTHLMLDQVVRLQEECSPQAHSPQLSSQACDSCTSAARSCRNACDLTSWEDCVRCDSACAVEEARCQSACQ